MTRHDFVALPDASTYTLGNARVPVCCIDLHRDVHNATDSSNGISTDDWQTCIDGVVTVDIEVSGAHIAAIRPARAASRGDPAYLDVHDSMVLPAFVDLHTHIGGSLPCYSGGVDACAVHAPQCCPSAVHRLSEASRTASAAGSDSMAILIVHSPADKGHTCERSRNPDGSLSGADRSTAADAELWDADDVFR